MEITVLHNQSLLDLALQHTGTIESIFEFAEANTLNITDDVVAGKILALPAEAFTNRDILAYYTAKNLQPATAFTKEDEQVFERQEGISIWAINLDFIVTKELFSTTITYGKKYSRYSATHLRSKGARTRIGKPKQHLQSSYMAAVGIYYLGGYMEFGEAI